MKEGILMELLVGKELHEEKQKLEASGDDFNG